MSSLHRAAAFGDSGSIKKIVADGTPVDQLDEFGDTPIMHAAIRGRVKAVEVLLKLGANPNFSRPNGATPLMAAAEGDSVRLVKILLKAGADPNMTDDEGFNAAFCAYTSFNHEICSILMEASGPAAVLPQPVATITGNTCVFRPASA